MRRQIFIRQNYGFDVVVEDFVTREYALARYDRIYSMGAWEHVRPGYTEDVLWRAQTRWGPRSAVQLPREATDAGDLSFERVIFFGLRPDDAQGSACGSRKGRF